MRRLKQKESLVATVTENGEVTIEDQFIGRLEGFRFRLDPTADAEQARTLRAAGVAALARHLSLRADKFYNAPDPEIDVTEQGGLMWGEYAVGKLVAGPDALSPQVQPFVDEDAGPEIAEKVRRRLGHWIDRRIAALFAAADRAARRRDAGRNGAWHRVSAGRGARRAAARRDRRRRQGARSGRPGGLAQARRPVRSVHRVPAADAEAGADAAAAGALGAGRGSRRFSRGAAGRARDGARGAWTRRAGYYSRAGYRLAGERAIRIDMLERLADMIRAASTPSAGFEASPDMLSITGLTLEQFARLMQGLGYQATQGVRPKRKAQRAAKDRCAGKCRSGRGRTSPVCSAIPPPTRTGNVSAGTPNSPPVEDPGDLPTEFPTDPPAEAPGDTPTETPPEPPAEAPGDLPNEFPPDPPSDTPGDIPTEIPGLNGTAEADVSETETFFTFVRAPRHRPDRGPREARKASRDKPKAKTHSGEGAELKNGPRRKGRPPAGEKPPMHEARPHRQEKPIDPDNPFAALMALKLRG